MLHFHVEREGGPLESKEKAFRAARATIDKKAKDVLILDLKNLTPIADYFIICSGESTTHVKAIAERVEEIFTKAGINPLGIEGLDYSHWVLMDYGDVIVHIFEEETRKFYELEKLWIDAKRIPLSEMGDE
ncbi:MAG: ribosome silencing factor [Nitrospirota bacterium]